MTAMPTFAGGQEPLAAQWQTLLPIKAVKAIDQTVNNSAVLVNDSTLFLAVNSTATYEISGIIRYNSGTTPDIKFAWTGPTSATFYWSCNGLDTAASGVTGTVSRQALAIADTVGIGGTGNDLAADIHGILTVSSTSGNLQFQWAQNTANASNTIVRANSFLIARQIA
ncbi:MAG TPA: hypothetical protein VFG87_28065 [Amycolatopsis sp.]|nr:hypothetical protein [Amycolatopsis sp.]